jgi:hypothetical protein
MSEPIVGQKFLPIAKDVPFVNLRLIHFIEKEQRALVHTNQCLPAKSRPSYHR